VSEAPYNPHQIYTHNGFLVMKTNAISSDVILRLKYPLCLSNGFVEVGIVSTEGVRKRIYVGILNFHPTSLTELFNSGRALGVLQA
jgi:hypothetical protein